MRLISKFCKSLFVAIFCVAVSAHAQDRLDAQALNAASSAQTASDKNIRENPPGTFFDSLNNVAEEMGKRSSKDLSAGLFDAGLEISAGTIVWAKGIAGTLAIVYLISEAINYMSSKNSSLAGVLFDVAIPVAFCAYLLVNYADLIKSLAAPDGKSLLDYIRSLGGDPLADIMGMYGAILGMVATVIKQAYATWLEAVLEFSLKGMALGFVDTLVTLILALAMIYIIISGVAEVIGLILLGPFLGAVAIAFGPIFIAGFATPWTREYFSKWLGFLVASAVLSGVLSVCIKIATTLFKTFNFTAIAGDYTPSATGLLIAIVVVMGINSLIKQAPSIATALVPGGFGANKGAGGDMNNAVKGAAEKGAAIKNEHSKITAAAKQKMDAAAKTKSVYDVGV